MQVQIVSHWQYVPPPYLGVVPSPVSGSSGASGSSSSIGATVSVGSTVAVDSPLDEGLSELSSHDSTAYPMMPQPQRPRTVSIAQLFRNSLRDEPQSPCKSQMS